MCLQSITVVFPAALGSVCRLHFNTWFSIQLSAYTYLFDSHLSLFPSQSYTSCQTWFFPSKRWLEGFLWQISIYERLFFLVLKGTFTLGGSNCLLSLVFLLSSKVAAFSAVRMWLTSFPDTQQKFLMCSETLARGGKGRKNSDCDQAITEETWEQFKGLADIWAKLTA